MRPVLSIFKFILLLILVVAGVIGAIAIGMPQEAAIVAIPSIMLVSALMFYELRGARRAETITFMTTIPEADGKFKKVTGNKISCFVAFALIITSILTLTISLYYSFTGGSASLLNDVEGSQAAMVRFFLSFSNALMIPIFGIWCGFSLIRQSHILSHYRSLLGFIALGSTATFIYEIMTESEYDLDNTFGSFLGEFNSFIFRLFFILSLFIVLKSKAPRKFTRKAIFGFMLLVVTIYISHTLLLIQNNLGGFPIFYSEPDKFSFAELINSIKSFCLAFAFAMMAYWASSLFSPIRDKTKSILLISFSLAISVIIYSQLETIIRFIFIPDEYDTLGFLFRSTTRRFFDIFILWFMIIDIARPGLVEKPYQVKKPDDKTLPTSRLT